MADPRVDVEVVRRALESAAERLGPRLADPAPSTGVRHAAVAAVLRDDPAGARVLLIRRAKNDSDPWSGHMAFPGGRHDAADADLLATALRETREELGLDLASEGVLLGRLEPIQAISRGRPLPMSIAPFVFAVGAEPVLRPNQEVEEALWAPLGPMIRGELVTHIDYEREGHALRLPAYDVEGRVVWGLTHRMLTALFDLL